MMAERAAEDPNIYEDGIERRTLDLRPDGVSCIPLLALSNFQSVHVGTDEHIHPGCVEVSMCYGFSSPQHFATAFKRIMGVSPRHFKKVNG